ncbi:hypothetical protein SAMN06295967_10499 [Belliella buryatensis]|uniref:Uncharacterized protein n=1 Tax=Belliella buryatensis TaxID=1500549 RepID=A0A239C7C5_9BACT|nr:hypothetical protein [Belliella buryatensis]SNS15521.1 hypothetical protein SAMN06295967_10499 [Belliella buryatensis]
MIDNILSIERKAKLILRYGIAFYFIYFGIINLWGALSSNGNILTGGIVMLLGLCIGGLILSHFKQPKLSAIGAGIAAVFFLIVVAILAFMEIRDGFSMQMILLRVIKDLLLAIACVVLCGESLKEVIREKITKPFPVR